MEDVGGLGGQGERAVMPGKRLFADREFGFAGESGGGSAPVAYRVAVDADDFGSVGERVTFGKKRKYVVLIRGKRGVWGEIREFRGWCHG